ncbi:MAG: hypothetical protein IPO60_03445 [Flavobacteriales bacterium]|jgi:hypothetical protein|nr:hypothetical protein [Flavobacteriales bacterium]MBK6892225.1 hypothetical protein [Flavobacteriales bacterium]MBK7246355.1 hypothetical protein [Flavobacteriales bacterium]MBK9059869.1 hypothetical protein [Flavobacteriales bacterium]MBK9597394.1 hypothetical protein [Flavobacteriales bacterium]
MDRERLTELLQDPSQVAKQDLTALRAMAERFPWFSGAHLLLAVGEHETGDVLANDRQNSPAAFLPSRAVLFDLVRQEEQQRVAPLRVVKDEMPLQTDTPPKEPIRENGLEAAPRELLRTILPQEEAKSALQEVPETALPEERSTVAVPDQKDPAPTPSISPVAEKAQMPPDTHAAGILELQIKEAILATGYDLGQYEAPPATAAPPPEILPPAAPTLPPVLDVTVEMADPQRDGPIQETPAPAPPSFSPDTRLRFTDWLDRSEPEIHSTAPLAPEQPPIAAIPPAMAVVSPSTVAADPPDLDPQEIMEQFIQRSSPLPSAAKAEFFNPQQAAKRSLQDDGLVSETLARIHEKQGNLAKAKEVYDRLAVKHPEKSVYFAALSKALEGRMNK